MNHLLQNADFSKMSAGFSTEMLYACLAEERDGLLPQGCEYTKHVAELVYARVQYHQNALVRLSNGTLIGQIQYAYMLNGLSCTRAEVLPNDREMTDAEWNEYADHVAKTNATKIAARKTFKPRKALVIPERPTEYPRSMSKKDALDYLVRVECHIFRLVPNTHSIDWHPELRDAQQAVYECEKQVRREVRNGLIPLLPEVQS